MRTRFRPATSPATVATTKYHRTVNTLPGIRLNMPGVDRTSPQGIPSPSATAKPPRARPTHPATHPATPDAMIWATRSATSGHPGDAANDQRKRLSMKARIAAATVRPPLDSLTTGCGVAGTLSPETCPLTQTLPRPITSHCFCFLCKLGLHQLIEARTDWSEERY